MKLFTIGYGGAKRQPANRPVLLSQESTPGNSVVKRGVVTAHPPVSAGGEEWRCLYGLSAGGAPAPRPIPAWPGGVRDRASGETIPVLVADLVDGLRQVGPGVE